MPITKHEIEIEAMKLDEKCPKCGNMSLMYDNDSIWCTKCNFEEFP